jgi:hypothetical protein
MSDVSGSSVVTSVLTQVPTPSAREQLADLERRSAADL